MRRAEGPTNTSNAAKKRAAIQGVDEYLAAAPQAARATLEALRVAIKAAAPEATEVISYQIPTFRYHGALVAFAAFRNHCGFYVMSPSTLEAHREEVKGYELAKATVRFPLDRPIPAALVIKIVKARMAENEARAKA